MLLAYSYSSKAIRDKINACVGKSFGLIDRLKMRGVGSQRFSIKHASEDIIQLFEYQSGESFTNIELRPTGIIFWFRARVDNWVLVMGYDNLNIQLSGKTLIVSNAQWLLELLPANNLPIDEKFVAKLIERQGDCTT